MYDDIHFVEHLAQLRKLIPVQLFVEYLPASQWVVCSMVIVIISSVYVVIFEYEITTANPGYISKGIRTNPH